jgi:RNase adaptor protein for sRNA GlmZ degradation
MKLIIIYGPPACGKMTIAKELCKITNAKFFPHNFIFDLINPIFGDPRKNDFMWDLYEEIKINIIKYAKKEGVNLVLTEIYNKPRSNERIKEFLKEIKKLKVNYKFVKISCSEKELLKRVEKLDRKNTKKLNSKKEYKEIMKNSNLNSEIDFVKNIVIDSTNISAKEVAKKIKKSMKLSTCGKKS